MQSITAVFLSLQSSHHLVAWISGLPHSLAPMGSLYKNHSLCMCHELSVTSVTCPFLFHTPLLQHTIWTVYVISRGSVLSWSKHRQSHFLTLPLLVCDALLWLTLAQDYPIPPSCTIQPNGCRPTTANPLRVTSEQHGNHSAVQQPGATAGSESEIHNCTYTGYRQGSMTGTI